MNKEYISVIVPIYNSSQVLHRCIDSLYNQSYKNIEIILVNDGSTDSSGKTCDSYAQMDSRIRVIHQPKRGVSSARNIGLKEVSGDYILFVDSDDWIDIDTIEKCLEEFKKNSLIDCVLFSYTKEYKENSYIKHTFDANLFFKTKQEFNSQVYRKLFGLTNEELSHPERLEYMTTCWGKMYKRTVIDKSRFIDIEKIGSCEDGLFNMDALVNCNCAVYLDKPFYHYRYTKDSLTSKYRPNLPKQWENLFSEMQKKVLTYHLSKDFQEALNNRIALSILGIGMNEMSNPECGLISFTKYIRNYITSIRYREAISTMDLKRLPFVWKVLMFCCKFRCAFGVSVILKIIRIIKSKF